jgi:hypothetical protein
MHMALEELLKELITEVRGLKEETVALRELRADAIETVKNSAASTATKGASKKADAKAEDPKTEPTKTDEPAAPAGDDEYVEAKDLVKKYVTGSDRPEEVQARKEKIRFLLRHDKICKPEKKDSTDFDVTDAMPGDGVRVLIKNLNAAIEKGDLTEPAKADDLL